MSDILYDRTDQQALTKSEELETIFDDLCREKDLHSQYLSKVIT